MNKTVSSVIDDINEWAHPQYGTTYYVTAIFTDESVGSVGRKDQDAALEVQGLLRESIGQELDFTLEPKGQTKTGRDKFTIKGFGTPGGAATYTAPSPGSGRTEPSGGQAGATGSRNRSPEHDQEGMRHGVAMKAAAIFAQGKSYEALGEAFAFIDRLLLDAKTSEPASSAYVDGSGTVTPVVQAGAGSETTSPAAGPVSTVVSAAEAGAASDGAETPAGDTSSAGEQADDPADRGGQSDGEAGCPPHDLDLDVAPKAMRYPCRRCKAWVKPTMAADEAEEART